MMLISRVFVFLNKLFRHVLHVFILIIHELKENEKPNWKK